MRIASMLGLALALGLGLRGTWAKKVGICEP